MTIVEGPLKSMRIDKNTSKGTYRHVLELYPIIPIALHLRKGIHDQRGWDTAFFLSAFRYVGIQEVSFWLAWV